MLAPVELYSAICGWLQVMGVVGHASGLASVAELVTALLVSQSLRPSDLARTVLSPATVGARHRYRRVRRILSREWLSSRRLTPILVRTALALVPDRVPHLAMDTVRCGGWEVLTIGVVWHGRVLPVGWEVLAYPWPKGQFTPAVVRLLWRVGQTWPTERRPHLVADRGFPSLKLFRTVEQLGWGWTIRLRAKLNVGIDGQPQALAALIAASRPGRWTCRPMTYGTGQQRVAGHLVLGRPDALPVLPRHQATPGSLRQRARRHLARQREIADKHPTRPTSTAHQTDGWVALFTSHSTWLDASQSYTRRWATEASYRDAQGGYDGQHGWNLEPTVAREPQAALVDHLFGLWALGACIQTALGDRLTRPHLASPLRDARARWTTTDRLSVWMRARFALTDPFGDLRPHLLAILHTTTGDLDAALNPPPSTPLRLPHAA